MKKIFYMPVFLSLLLFSSCASHKYLTVEEVDLCAQSEQADKVVVSTSVASKIKGLFKEDNRSAIQKLQYYVSDTVVYTWDSDNKDDTKLKITKDGKLIKSNEYKDKKFIIYDNTLGIVSELPTKVNGKYKLTVEFGNIKVNFLEGNDGFFYLDKQPIVFEDFKYSTEDSCLLCYKTIETNKSDVKRKHAKGKKIRN